MTITIEINELANGFVDVKMRSHCISTEQEAKVGKYLAEVIMEALKHPPEGDAVVLKHHHKFTDVGNG